MVVDIKTISLNAVIKVPHVEAWKRATETFRRFLEIPKELLKAYFNFWKTSNIAHSSSVNESVECYISHRISELHCF